MLDLNKLLSSKSIFHEYLKILIKNINKLLKICQFVSQFESRWIQIVFSVF